MLQKIKTGPIIILDAVLGFPIAVNQAPHQESAQGKGRIHAAQIIDLASWDRPQVSDDRKGLERCRRKLFAELVGHESLADRLKIGFRRHLNVIVLG